MAKKLRTRNHKVVLNRSAGGDFGITFLLAILGVFMFIPMLYVILQSLKPLDELWMFPPKFYVIKPTFANFGDLFTLMSDSWVPFSRYIFNTVFISFCGTFGNLLLASMAAYALAKLKFPGRNWMFQLIVLSLMFHQTVNQVTHFIIMSALNWVDTYLAIIVPALASTMGLYLMKQFMESSVSDAVLESARLDGASELKTFNYAINQIVTGGIARAGAGSAATVVMMLVPICVFVISQSNIIETMGSSGMKD